MEKQTLPALVQNMSQIMQQLVESGGELSPDLEAMLDTTTTALQAKTDSYAFVMDRLEHEAEFWKAKADAMGRIARSCSNLRERLKDGIKIAMIQLDTKEIKGEESRFALTKMPQKLVVDETVLPVDFKVATISYSPNKEMIKRHISNGDHVPGAHFEDVVALRKYLTKKGS